MPVRTLCWRWHERSHPETFKELLPELQKTNLAAVREVSRLLINRWRAAEVIRRRAEAIQQWPLQQRRLAQMAGIVGSMVAFVITGLITRLVLVRLGAGNQPEGQLDHCHTSSGWATPFNSTTPSGSTRPG
jgi:hypothetical protein